MRLKLLSIWLCCGLTGAWAQSQRVDSLFAVLRNHTQQDTFRVNRMNDLTNIWGLAFHQYDSLANEALILSRRLGYKTGQSKALFTRGMILYSMNRNNPTEQVKAKQGFQWLQEAVLLAKQTGDKKLTVTFLTQLAASIRMSNGEKKKAITYDREALALASGLADKRLISDCERLIALDYESVDGNYPASLEWNMRALQTARSAQCVECQLFSLRAMGEVYTTLKDYRQALGVLKQALRISQQPQAGTDGSMQFYILSSLGNVYDALHQYPKALRSYEQAVAFRQKEYPAFSLAMFDNRLAAIYEAQGNHNKAIAHGVRGMVKAKQDANNWWMADISTTLCQAYLNTNRLDSARYYGLQAFVTATESRQKELIRDASKALSTLYARQKQFDQAYYYQNLYYTNRDSLFNDDITRKATAMQYTYQLNAEKNRVKALLREKELETWQRKTLIAGAVLLLLLAGALSAFLLNRAKLRRLEEAQQLRRQIAQDLHDEVGSTLSSISLLSGHTDKLLSENRPETAQRMVQKIYTDARQILESIDEIIWTINPGNDSLQRIALRLQEYARPLMESGHIQFSFVVAPELDNLPISMEARRNLFLIGKEAINNLVKYSEAREASVRFERQHNQLVVLIEDNGRGFDTTLSTTRNGQQSMSQRAKLMDGKLVVESVPGQGTSLQLYINI